ncbi:MAG: hypothetical protein ACM3NT_03325 [Methylocystaceae bacterium]
MLSRKSVYALTILLVITFFACIFVHHGRTETRLRAAEDRLKWLEPDKPAFSFEAYQPINQEGNYNPAEFELITENKIYRRPYYTPDINTNTTPEPDWCYVPRISQISQHRLFLFSDGGSFFSDLRGILRLGKLPKGWYRSNSVCILVINCRVKDVFWRDNDLMVVVTPALKGYQMLRVRKLQSSPPSAWLLDNNYGVWEEAYR